MAEELKFWKVKYETWVSIIRKEEISNAIYELLEKHDKIKCVFRLRNPDVIDMACEPEVESP